MRLDKQMEAGPWSPPMEGLGGSREEAAWGLAEKEAPGRGAGAPSGL